MIQFTHNKAMNFNTNHTQTGISFIEILVVLFLLSIMLSFSIPRFMNLQQGQNKKKFSADFMTLVADATRQAIVTQKVQQIFWDLANQTITHKSFDSSIETKNKHEKFKVATDTGSTPTISIPQNLKILNFFIGEEDHVKSNSTLQTVFTYIMPDATSQPVLINMQDDEKIHNNTFHIRINPFYSQVSINNGIAQP